MSMGEFSESSKAGQSFYYRLNYWQLQNLKYNVGRRPAKKRKVPDEVGKTWKTKRTPKAKESDKENIRAVVEQSEDGQRTFHLGIIDKRRFGRGSLETAVMRWLIPDDLGVYRPSDTVFVESMGAVIPVRTQFVQSGEHGPAGFRLLTLKDRILEIELQEEDAQPAQPSTKKQRKGSEPEKDTSEQTGTTSSRKSKGK